jgi:hypothetical protein
MDKSIFEVCGVSTVKGVIADTVHYMFVEEGIKISDIESRASINEAMYSVFDTITASTGIKEFSSPDTRKIRKMVESEMFLRMGA